MFTVGGTSSSAAFCWAYGTLAASTSGCSAPNAFFALARSASPGLPGGLHDHDAVGALVLQVVDQVTGLLREDREGTGAVGVAGLVDVVDQAADPDDDRGQGRHQHDQTELRPDRQVPEASGRATQTRHDRVRRIGALAHVTVLLIRTRGRLDRAPHMADLAGPDPRDSITTSVKEKEQPDTDRWCDAMLLPRSRTSPVHCHCSYIPASLTVTRSDSCGEGSAHTARTRPRRGLGRTDHCSRGVATARQDAGLRSVCREKSGRTADPPDRIGTFSQRK